MTEQRHGQEQVKSTREAQFQTVFPGTSGFMAVQVARLEAESRQRGAAEQAERQGIRESLAEIRRQLKAKKAHAAPVFWGGDFFFSFFFLLLLLCFLFGLFGWGEGLVGGLAGEDGGDGFMGSSHVLKPQIRFWREQRFHNPLEKGFY